MYFELLQIHLYFPFIKTYIVFGWGEFRGDGKHREENRVENSDFHCLAKEGKWGGRKTWEKIFSPGPTKFILPNWEEKAGEKVLSQHFYKNAISQRLTTQRDRIRRRKQTITTQPPNPTPPPNTAT